MMRALSIQQPWAWLIVNGFKNIENRSWATSQRGPVLIHAGQTLDRDAAEALWSGRHPVTGLEWTLPVPRDFLRGGIVGEAVITACVDHHASEWFVGKYGFVLASARKLPFTRWRGQQGFFPVDLAPASAGAGDAQGSLL
jgi:hypothetical protein